MYDIALYPKQHDILFFENSKGLFDILFIDGAERVAQQIKIAIKTVRAEWLLDTREGIPYQEYVFVRNPNYKLIQNLFSAAISKVDGVKYIKSLELRHDLVRRTLYIDWLAILNDDKKISNSEVVKYG